MAKRPPDLPRYTAFLSYSHKDAAAAGRLHRRLEAYRLPRRLVGNETTRGPVPERLAPIFRDREELPAATDLSETVREALVQSGALIILCSPHAAESLWVAEEIETFRRLHPDRPILAAILDGDPPDCFPAMLRALGRDGTWHEPLATDLRSHRDGPRLGLLKLVAGITGVGLDALVQRDAQRKIRRVTTVTGAAVIAMLIMAALALVAVSARREAERQRAEAEGLVEFMLTDLRPRLREVGRLDIMSLANERALAFYAGQPALADRPTASAMQARVRQANGEDELFQGHERAAEAQFREAHRATAALIERYPADPDVIFAHAQSDYWMGEIHVRHNQVPQALRYFRQYARAAERLLAIAPDNPGYVMEIGYSLSNIGRLELNRDPVIAQAFFATALGRFQQVERLRPRDELARRQQGNIYAWLGDSFYARRLWREALAARRRQYQIYLQLQRANPMDMNRLYDLALAERAVGRQLSILGDRNGAAPLMLTAYRHARLLRQRDSRNVDWLLLKAKIECELLYASPGPGQAIPAPELRRNLAEAVAELSAQHNSEAAQLDHCLQAARAQPART